MSTNDHLLNHGIHICWLYNVFSFDAPFKSQLLPDISIALHNEPFYNTICIKIIKMEIIFQLKSTFQMGKTPKNMKNTFCFINLKSFSLSLYPSQRKKPWRAFFFIRMIEGYLMWSLEDYHVNRLKRNLKNVIKTNVHNPPLLCHGVVMHGNVMRKYCIHAPFIFIRTAFSL